jgi:phosphoribosylamine--glycine ligase
MSDKKVLIIGSGGREYAFAWKLSRDQEVDQVYCAPGNGGTESFCTNLDLDVNNHSEVLDTINELKIDLTLIGPEAPLADGIVDYLESNGVMRVFGPDSYGSQLESSKLFARDLMREHQVPQPRYQKCSSIREATDLKNKWGLPLVVKADGLAAGKGVIICNDENSFSEAMDIMFNDPQFGDASRSVSVEECLVGEELSIFAVCDGENYRILNTAQDHKRVYDGDQGPNTGGMGAYSPTPLSTDDIISKTERRIIKPVLSAMRDRGSRCMDALYLSSRSIQA